MKKEDQTLRQKMFHRIVGQRKDTKRRGVAWTGKRKRAHSERMKSGRKENPIFQEGLTY